ncbi:TetR/AcrR family transcriptional regulator [Polyangium sp. y55x31]|uniref:TetR/AcrR family transcriptional regulator n=1 Tax=Polyangium sp. y55x31 TaxID=3042688 RepID=UPI002482D07A|nr:TetR/AcrR family transcriptional regulator [Polyangium sp. y55x31]MDI1475328.1 helix-turn-helix domain-containing protein [Polyangium sp. y55x31]
MTAEVEARGRILAAARRLFFAHGFGRVTMDEIAVELAMSKKTLYRHFASKEELCEAVIDATFIAIDAELAGALDDASLGFEDKLERFMRIVAGGYEQARGPLLTDLQRDAPSLWARVDEWRSKVVHTRTRTLFYAGKRAGVFRPDVPEDFVVRIVINNVQNILRPDVLAALGMNFPEAFAHCKALLLDGIRARPGEDGRGAAH